MIRQLLWLVPAVLALVVLGKGMAVEGMPVVAVDPEHRAVTLGDGAFDVDVTVDDVKDPDGLGGYTLVMEYDASILHALDVVDSGYLASTGNEAVFCESAIDETQAPARLAIFCTTIALFDPPPGPRPDEPAVLAVVTFEPVDVGSTQLNIAETGEAGGTETQLTDLNGNTLQATVLNGKVIVSAPTSTSTPTPQAPTAPGDVDCDTDIDPIDAALILQFAASLLGEIPCSDAGDVNGDGVTNALDAALVLQFSAGMLAEL